jgi:cytochrome c biogenesis protein CcmG/thiol:disulfide interchange protein DsbE
MSRVSPLLLIPPLVFAALAALFLWGMGRGDPNAMPSTREGGPAPVLTVTPLGDLPGFDAAALTAPGVKVVNFWASWCAPCRAEHPMLEKLAGQGLTIYGVNYKDDPAKALAFLADLGNPFAAAVADPRGRTGLDWGLYGVPETFVIDGEGKVLLRFAGPLTERVMADTVGPALAAAGWKPAL